MVILSRETGKVSFMSKSCLPEPCFCDLEQKFYIKSLHQKASFKHNRVFITMECNVILYGRLSTSNTESSFLGMERKSR